MNGLIADAEINSFCVKGICYYRTCENNKNCRIVYCKYHLLSSEEKCSINNDNSFKDFNLFLHYNKLPQIIANKMQTSSYNREDNNIIQ